jgi:hypothetical protein
MLANSAGNLIGVAEQIRAGSSSIGYVPPILSAGRGSFGTTIGV